MVVAAACIFCRIIAKEIPSQIILEKENMIAFRDLNPQAPTHILIVPKKHIPSLSATEEGDAHLLGEIQILAKELAQKTGIQEGFRIVANNGRQAGQSVDHLHYHLLGGRRMSWPPG